MALPWICEFFQQGLLGYPKHGSVPGSSRAPFVRGRTAIPGIGGVRGLVRGAAQTWRGSPPIYIRHHLNIRPWATRHPFQLGICGVLFLQILTYRLYRMVQHGVDGLAVVVRRRPVPTGVATSTAARRHGCAAVNRTISCEILDGIRHGFTGYASTCISLVLIAPHLGHSTTPTRQGPFQTRPRSSVLAAGPRTADSTYCRCLLHCPEPSQQLLINSTDPEKRRGRWRRRVYWAIAI